MRTHDLASFRTVPVVTSLVVFLVTLLAMGTHAPAQQPLPASRPTSQPASRPTGPIAVELDVQLLNFTDAPMRKQSGGNVSGLPITSAPVHLLVIGPHGQQTIDTESDASGRVQLALGTFDPQSTVTVVAEVGQREFIAYPFEVWRAPSEPLHLFQITHERRHLHQRINRIVTREDVSGKKPRIHVRQIVTLRHWAMTVFVPQEGAGGDYVYPVPRGAELIELRVGGRGWPQRDLVALPNGEHGVPIRHTVYPPLTKQNTAISIMGTYTMPVEVGSTVNLGLRAAVDTDGLVLALEEPHFQLVDDPDATPTQDGGSQTIPTAMSGDVRTHIYQLARVPAGTDIQLPVHFGPPEVHQRTKVITVTIVLGFLLSIGLGLLVAHSRRTLMGSGEESGGASR